MRVIILTGVLMVGCASMPSQDEINNAYYGPYPDSYQDIVKGYMAQRLKDPNSADFTFTSVPVRRATGNRFEGVKYGWAVCPYINAKNSFGGYVGSKRYYFVIQDNQITMAGEGQYGASAVCGG